MNVSPITVGIIDDDLLYSQIVTMRLKRDGMNVLFHARNGQIGIEMLTSCIYKPQIIIVDIQMPVMDGFETIRFIKQTWPELVTIAHSSLADLQSQERIISNGAHAFVLKENIVELVDTIHALTQTLEK